MKSLICTLICWHDAFFTFCEKYLSSFLQLAIRLWLAYIFLPSGYGKLISWDTTLYLFQYEYTVPYIPYNVAAVLATGVELIFSSLLLIGLFTRFSIVPLFILKLVINLTYPTDLEHTYWCFLMLTVMFYGPGWFSIDYILSRKFKR